MKKVVVGMSGGVDSAVAAYLLKKEGYDVIGVTLRTWESDDGEESRCCEIDDARMCARTLGIPYHVFNCIPDFKRYIVDEFINDYLGGFTPNPCVICNRKIKWERLLYYAKILGADLVATGHYASVIKTEQGRYTVKKASQANKDQTYMLYRLNQEQLKKTLMPLGGYTKDEVRQIARDAGLEVASKPDSQEICFVPEGSYADFIKKEAADRIPPEGDFIDEDGKILGKHKGIIHYTVGQGKRLGIALGRHVYVKEIDAKKNTVTLSSDKEITCSEIICRDMNYTALPAPAPGEEFECTVKVRYHHAGQKAKVITGEDETRIIFDEPVRFAAPGQSAVFYDGDILLGGGIIKEIIYDKQTIDF